MKRLKYASLCLLTAALAFSCVGQDDYLKYVPDTDGTPVGRPETAVFLGGNERVKLSGRLSSDPKVKKVGVFWMESGESKSHFFDVDLSKNRSIDEIIPVPEGTYNFEVRTYDADDNSSIAITASGVAYGPNYVSGCFNRIIETYRRNDDGNVEIVWEPSPENSVRTVVAYRKNGEEEPREVTVDNPVDGVLTVLEAPEANEQLEIRFSVLSHYLPDEAFEEFFPSAPTEYVINVPPPPPTDDISNGGGPQSAVEGERINGNWGVPKGWNVTDNVRNQAGNTVGGWKNENGGLFHFESQDWNGPGFENGKVWQSPTLPAGTYLFTARYQNSDGDPGKVMYVAAAAGDALPDIADIASGTLAHKEIVSGQTGEYTVEFTLTEPTQVSLGLVVTLGGNNGGSNHWLQFKYMSLARYVNTGEPVEGDRVNGNWGVPKGWNISDNVRNQVGGTLGGWKNEGGKGLFHFESRDWSGAGYDNGKVWQSPTLPAGTYELSTYYWRGNTTDGQTIDLVAAEGAQLPDRDGLGGALASKRLPRGEQDRIHSVTFTLTEPKQVSMGLLVTLDGSEQYLQFTWMKLTRVQ